MQVDEFWLGIPPKIKTLWTNADGTDFTLNWIPLWGFVRIAGESSIPNAYYGKDGNLLHDKEIRTKLEKKQKIYTKSWQPISEQERHFLTQKIAHQAPPGHNFYEKSLWQKSIVLVAGVCMNFLLAVGIFFCMFLVWVKPVWINTIIETNTPSLLFPTLEEAINNWLIIENPWVILLPLEDSVAEKSGIQSEDVLTKINNTPIISPEDAKNYINENPEKPMTFFISRNTHCKNKSSCPPPSTIQIGITPNDEGKIGSYLVSNYEVQSDFTYTYGLVGSFTHAIHETYAQIRLTLSGLKMLITNIITPETPEDREEALKQVAWPIGIVGVISQTFTRGWELLLLLTAIISINLGVFNLLPIPALDGGRLLFMWLRTGIEFIFWKNTGVATFENSLHVFFFILLIALSVIIAYNDIMNLF